MSSNEGGDESLPAGVNAPTAAPTFSMAQPEEVVEFVERARVIRAESPTGTLTIVAVTPPIETRPQCEWENCTAPSVATWRWRREAYNGRDDAFDLALYCDGHGAMAATHGAVLEKK